LYEINRLIVFVAVEVSCKYGPSPLLDVSCGMADDLSCWHQQCW